MLRVREHTLSDLVGTVLMRLPSWMIWSNNWVPVSDSGTTTILLINTRPEVPLIHRCQCEVVICFIVLLRILFHINAVAKFTAFAAKVIPYHLDLWAICITVPTSTPNYMLVPICPNGCHCFVKHKWVCESSVKSHICPHMKWAKWNYFGMKILYVLRKWQFQSIEQSIQFRLALHLQKRLASLAWLILLCFSNIQFAPPKGVFSGCNGGISTDAKAKLDSGFSSRVFPLGPICITTTIFYKYYIIFLRNKYYIYK